MRVGAVGVGWSVSVADDASAAATASPPKRHAERDGSAPRARTRTSVAPRRGPLHGSTPSTRAHTSRSRADADVYSRALLLTSTVASDARARGATHATERSLPHAARRDAPPTRHSSRASASDADEKPRPRTVSGAPPSASARAGATQLTAADGWYVNDAAAADDAAGAYLSLIHI